MPEPKAEPEFVPAPVGYPPVSGPERYVLWVFAALFATIAIILLITIYAGHGSDG